MSKNIYLLESKEEYVYNDYNYYDSMVVVAENEREAILLSYEIVGILQVAPLNDDINNININPPFKNYVYESSATMGWVKKEDMNITLIGKANESIKESSVICLSYNAG
jgi:hypothetical protein